MNKWIKVLIILLVLYPIVVVLIKAYLNKKKMIYKEGERENSLSSLQINDRVVTISGIYGNIKGINKNIIDLEVAKNIIIQVDKSSIMGILK